MDRLRAHPGPSFGLRGEAGLGGGESLGGWLEQGELDREARDSAGGEAAAILLEKALEHAELGEADLEGGADGGVEGYNAVTTW